jgi:ribonuclease-3
LSKGAHTATPTAEAAASAVEERLAYRFGNRALLIEALTHSTPQAEGAPVNERLEFLGDRVLGLMAADALLRRFPDAPEGELAPRLNALVRRETCASVARALGLGAYVRSVGSAGPDLKPAILADACEAVIAALYLDGGLEAARALFEREWASALGAITEAPLDAKSALQEWSQERALGLPAYELLTRAGPDHEPVFTVRVGVKSLAPAEGTGASKRAAEQAAAAALLTREGLWGEAQAARASDLKATP